MTSANYKAADLLPKIQQAIDALEYPLAHAFCTRALQLEPENVDALELTGQVEIELGKLWDAKMHFQKAVSLQPAIGFTKFMYLGQLSGELEAIQNFQRGVDLMTQERLGLPEGSEEAQTLSRRISSALVSMTEIYLTDCCFELEAEQKCEAYLQQAVSVDPSNPEVYQTLASVRLSQVRNDEARDALERSMRLWIGLEPGHSFIPLYDSRIALVKMLLELSLYSRAFVVLEGLQKENDQVVDLWYLYGWAYYCQGEETKEEEERKGMWEDARECLEQAVNLYQQQEPDDEGMLQHSQELIQKIDGVMPRGDDEDEDEDEDEEGNGEGEVDDDEEMEV